MRIVFSGNTSWGMYNFRIALMVAFKNIGFDVWVVAPEDEYTSKFAEIGINFKPVKKLKRSGTNPIADIVLLREYIGIYKQIKPDFVFHYTIKPNIYGSFACKICNIRSISVTTGLGNAFSNSRFLFIFAKLLYKFSSSYASEVWFLNASDLNIFVENKILKLDKTYLLKGEGIDLELFRPTKAQFEDKPITFTLISRMLYDKGVEVFVKATNLLRAKGYNFSSILLGQIDTDNPEGISLSTIKEWQAAGMIEYMGSTSDVKPYIGDADCIVLPSYYKEGIPRILMEAAAMEKPIITTNNIGCIETVDNGINGFLCEMKDEQDLADKMELFLKLTAEQRQELGKAGREKMEKEFDYKIIIEIYLNKLNHYLNRSFAYKKESFQP